MYTVLSLSVIIGYMINDMLGLTLSIIMYAIMLLKKSSGSIGNRLMICLILSLPCSYISILGANKTHIYSWYNIFAVIYLFYLLRKIILNNIIISDKILIFSEVFLLLFIVSNIGEYSVDKVIKIGQYIMFFLLVIMSYIVNRDKHINTDADKYIDVLKQVILSISLGILTQWCLYEFYKYEVGYSTAFFKRTTYDLFFKGYSVASIIIGIGVIVSFQELIKKFTIKNVLYLIICLLSIVINTSRTGLICSILICCLMIIYSRKQYDYFYKIFLVSMMFIIFGYFIKEWESVRSSINLLNDNGRFVLIKHAIDFIFSDIRVFLLGIGLSSQKYEYVFPHNLVIESVLQVGILNTIVILGMIFTLFKNIKVIEYKYYLMYIILCSMLITAFVSGTYNCIILMILTYVTSANSSGIRISDKKLCQ